MKGSNMPGEGKREPRKKQSVARGRGTKNPKGFVWESVDRTAKKVGRLKAKRR